MRNPRGQGVRLREEILAAARKLLESGPAEEVTLRLVARTVGVTAPSIYTHFTNRDEIMRVIVEEAFEELQEALSGDDHLEPVDHLRAICDAYLQFAEERPQRYRLMFGGVWNAADAQFDAADQPDLSRLGFGALRILSDAIQRCADAGALDSACPFDDAVALWVSLHGLAELRRTAPLFPWPSTIEDELIRRVGRLR